jgi:hypothetical protein
MLRALLLFSTVVSSALAQEIIQETHLSQYLASVKSAMPRRGSSGFIEPPQHDRNRFTGCIGMLLENRIPEARKCLAAVNYQLGLLKDAGYHREYLVASEHHSGFKGLGTYVVDPDYLRNAVLEVPHPLFDAGTMEEGLAMFQKARGRALFISGTHRCADLDAASPCAGTTSACGPTQGARVEAPFRVSDAGHYNGNFFTAAHRALLRLSPSPVAISLHGNAEEPVDAELSDGTKAAAPRNAVVNRFRDALAANGVKAGSCNLPSDKPERFQLCGGSNVQSKLSNGVTDCSLSARHASGLFLHIEQRRSLRESPDAMVAAFRQVFAANGPGSKNQK